MLKINLIDQNLLEPETPTCPGGYEVSESGDPCAAEDCQECCAHDEREAGICLDCAHEEDPGEAIDRAMDSIDMDR